jgi:hypothetical protein
MTAMPLQHPRAGRLARKPARKPDQGAVLVATGQRPDGRRHTSGGAPAGPEARP